MNFQQVEYIIAVDRFKSFSKAAESCFITQATLSTMVKKLEQELGIIIFDRKTSPILTTESGKEIIEEGKKLLYHSKNIKQLAAILKGKIEGELKIGIIPTVAGNLLHRIIPTLLDKYPNLKLYITEITTTNIVNQLKTGEIDVGIVSTPLAKDDLEEEVMYYEKLKVYGKQKTDKEYVLANEIGQEKVWLLEEGNCLRNQFINLCALNPKKIKNNLIFEPNSFESLLNFVDNLEGLTLIPELYCKDLPEEKKRKLIDFKSPYPVREISLVYHRPYVKHRLISVLAEEIKTIIPPLLETSVLKNNEMNITKI
jgi:LysR family hydrogen peroxide-inducible transcriptional activator